MGKVVPLGGKHRSVRSMLGEIMSDGEIAKCVIVTVDKDDNGKWAHFNMTAAELAWVGALIQHLVFDDA